jgi:MoaA/NifB/PqqE/SkfB family radical SAM enzyme
MARKKIHLINDSPHRYEIGDLLEFCRKHKNLYICGAAENQEYLLEYFDTCKVNVKGYVVTDPQCQHPLQYRQIPIVAIDEVLKQPDTGIILGLSEKHYRFIIPKLREAGFKDYFIMTEWSKITLANQLKPRPIEEMTFEINIADHCNISCQMCDHYSQLSEECFVDMDIFERDMRRMGELFDHDIACISLVGGEPTLHPDLIKCMQITRREFPYAELIVLTNGLLLLDLENSPHGNFWQACKEYNFNITVTLYALKFDYMALVYKAEEYGVTLAMSSNIHANELTEIVKISDKHVFDLSGEAGKGYYLTCCYFNKFNVLKDGRYYMCPVSAHIGIFNKAFGQNLELTEADSLDIFKVQDWREFAKFAANYVPFCGHCDLKNWRAHSPWKASTKTINEYID